MSCLTFGRLDDKSVLPHPAPILHGEALLFLDIDGVMHSAHSTWGHFREDCCRQLARIVNATRCRIVLSSSWRCYPRSLERAVAMLRERCCGLEIAGCTPEFEAPDDVRALEILSFVEASGCDAARWVALDDEDLVGSGCGVARSHFCSAVTAEEMAPHVVRTDASRGLTVALADQCIAILRPRGNGSGDAGGSELGHGKHRPSKPVGPYCRTPRFD